MLLDGCVIWREASGGADGIDISPRKTLFDLHKGRHGSMAQKVKIFARDVRVGKLEDEVNEFIRGRKVQGIQFSMGTSAGVMVIYDE